MAEVAIVTGDTSGLGKAFCEHLLLEGIHVVGVSRRRTGTRDEHHTHIAGSVADQGTVDAAFDAAAAFGDLRIVINCAGTGVYGVVGEYSVEDIKLAMEGNLIGLIAFTDRAVSVMGMNGGDIVNIISTAGKRLRPAESVYTAAKWGAKAYTRTVREAVKAAKLPIRIFEVYPCGIKTLFWAQAVRPFTDGRSFPEPDFIVENVLTAVRACGDLYQRELSFERA
jgi:NAD(P)-dependent dehydrogenase (short-subunit alcohol dehydrogenase family)